jgi:hypothetical protein
MRIQTLEGECANCGHHTHVLASAQEFIHAGGSKVNLPKRIIWDNDSDNFSVSDEAEQWRVDDLMKVFPGLCVKVPLTELAVHDPIMFRGLAFACDVSHSFGDGGWLMS